MEVFPNDCHKPMFYEAKKIRSSDYRSCIFVSSERIILMCQLIPWAPRPCTITQLVPRHDSCLTQLLTRTQTDFAFPHFLSTSSASSLHLSHFCFSVQAAVTCGHSSSAMEVSAFGSHGLDTTRSCSSIRRRSRSVVDPALSLKKCQYLRADWCI
jgi:hypothetical protein